MKNFIRRNWMIWYFRTGFFLLFTTTGILLRGVALQPVAILLLFGIIAVLIAVGCLALVGRRKALHLKETREWLLSPQGYAEVCCFSILGLFLGVAL